MTAVEPSLPLIVLAGGKGTRLRALDATRPKPMVLVHGKPFLHWLIALYVGFGHRDFILSTGYLAEVIESYDWSGEFPLARFSFEREPEPLGTGGPVKMIFEKRGLAAAWLINGDTLLPQPLPAVPPGLEALYVALDKSQLYDATPNLAVKNGRVVAERNDADYFHGGALFLTREAVARYRGPAVCSIHELLAPSMAARLVGYSVVPGTCYDIGTPARHKRFESYLVSRI